MTKVAVSSGGSGITVMEAYKGWRPTQAWLAEMTRTTATRMFAQAGLEGDESGNKSTVAFHRGALTAQVYKIFGALFDQSAPEFSVSWVIDLLVYLDDLADIGFGYYLPRESRVVRLTEGWGRIGGGLPHELSEYTEGGIEPIGCDSVGRVVKTAHDFAPHDQGTEHSEVFRWGARSVDGLLSDLCERLPGRGASAPPEEITLYYNPQHQRARNRGDRWQNKLPGGAFVVARTGTQPSHYSVQVRREDEGGAAWFEVSREEARKWVLLAEKMVNATNRISAKAAANAVSFFLPDMLPPAWVAGLFACASKIIPAERGWTLDVHAGAMPLLGILLRNANIELI